MSTRYTEFGFNYLYLFNMKTDNKTLFIQAKLQTKDRSQTYKVETNCADEIVKHFSMPSTKRRLNRKPKKHFRK